MYVKRVKLMTSTVVEALSKHKITKDLQCRFSFVFRSLVQRNPNTIYPTVQHFMASFSDQRKYKVPLFNSHAGSENDRETFRRHI